MRDAVLSPTTTSATTTTATTNSLDRKERSRAMVFTGTRFPRRLCYRVVFFWGGGCCAVVAVVVVVVVVVAVLLGRRFLFDFGCSAKPKGQGRRR